MGSRGARLAIVGWAIGGVVLVLVDAIVRLLPKALEPLTVGPPDSTTLLAYLTAIVALAYTEGYRGFQQRFSPRVVVRAFRLADKASPLLVVFAPLVAMGLMHATRRRLISSWLLLLTIVGFVFLVRVLQQPWRGAVDAGVVIGLSWGTVVTLIQAVRAWYGRSPEVDADFP